MWFYAFIHVLFLLVKKPSLTLKTRYAEGTLISTPTVNVKRPSTLCDTTNWLIFNVALFFSFFFFEASLHTRLPLRWAVTCVSLSDMLSPGLGKKHSICLGNAACVRGHFVRECTKSRPSNTPTGNEIPNVIHTRSLMSIETSSFCNASIPRREGEPYLGGRWPSISNFSQFISLPKSNRTMMSGINQTLTPHIQDWDMYPFLSAQICLLSCWGSLAADLSPFFFLFFFFFTAARQHQTAGGLCMESAGTIHWKIQKDDMLRTLVPQPLHYSFILTNVLQKVLLEAGP